MPFGGPTDGQDPHQPSGGLKAGSCGERGAALHSCRCTHVTSPPTGLQPAPTKPRLSSSSSFLPAGYGELSQQAWPYWSAIAVGPGHPLAANASRSPLGGCGACVELQCDPRPGFEARAFWVLQRPVPPSAHLGRSAGGGSATRVQAPGLPVTSHPHSRPPPPPPGAGPLPRRRRRHQPGRPRHRHLHLLRARQGGCWAAGARARHAQRGPTPARLCTASESHTCLPWRDRPTRGHGRQRTPLHPAPPRLPGLPLPPRSPCTTCPSSRSSPAQREAR